MNTRSIFTGTKKIALKAALVLTLVNSSGAGCAPINNRTEPMSTPSVTPKVLYSGAQCGFDQSQPGLRWIDSEAGLKQTYHRLTRMQGSAKPPPTVDFGNHGVLLVDMGTRPTAGYSLGLGNSAAQVTQDAILILPIVWRAPPQGVMLAQVLTNPCILLSLPRGEYQRIRVLDQDGAERGNIEIPALH